MQAGYTIGYMVMVIIYFLQWYQSCVPIHTISL